MRDLALRPGMLIGSRHRLESRIAVGGSSEVWTATHVVTGGSVALKILKAGRPDDVRRFVREARIASTLEHPHVVRVLDILELSSTRPAMVIELLRGETLAERLTRGPLTLREMAKIFVPVVDAVRHAHRHGIVHRDLKPANIFLCAGGVKVLDFGIAKLRAPDGGGELDGSLRTETGVTMGTPHYMAPEQVFGDADVDAGVDVWALGVCFYECLSGARPFEGDSYGQIFKQIALADVVPIRQLAPRTPETFSRLVHAMLTRDRAVRIQDLEDVEAALRAVALPEGDRPTPVAPTPVPKPSRSVGWRVAAGAAIVAMGLGGVIANRQDARNVEPLQAEARVSTTLAPPSSPAPLPTTNAASLPGILPDSPPLATASSAVSLPTAMPSARAASPKRMERTPSTKPAASAGDLPGGVSGVSPY